MHYSPKNRRDRLPSSALRSSLRASLLCSLILAQIPLLAGDRGYANWNSKQSSSRQAPSVQRMLTIASQFEKQGDYSRAAGLYQKILQQHPGHLLAQKRLDLCLAETNRTAQSSSQSVAHIPTYDPAQQSPNSGYSNSENSEHGVTTAVPHPDETMSSPEPQPFFEQAPISKPVEVPLPPKELPEPTREITELKPLAKPAATITISDDEWDSEPVQSIVIRPNPSNEIPRLKDDIPRLSDDDEPEMLSVTTNPTSFEPSAPIRGDAQIAIEPSHSAEGPRLSLKKLETRIDVQPDGLTASAAAVTQVVQQPIAEEHSSPYVQSLASPYSDIDHAPKDGGASLDDEEIPHIGRVGLSEDEDDAPGRAVVSPESETMDRQPQKTPAQPAKRRPSSSGTKQNSDSGYSTELLDENCTDLMTPDYRTGLLSVCPRATQEIRRLIRSMETPNVRIRKTSLLRLCNSGKDARAAVPAVRELLFDPNETIRVLAAYSLWNIGHDASGMLTLTDVVVTGTPENSCLAAYTLGEIGPSAGEALPLLEHISANGTGLMRLHAWEAVWRIKAGDDRALDAMLSFLKSDDVHERWLATYMLGNTGSKRLDMIHDLSKALDDSSTIVQTGAGFALGCIGPDAAMATPRLITIFETSEFDNALRMTAFEALSEIEPLTAQKFQTSPTRRPERIQRTSRTTRE